MQAAVRAWLARDGWDVAVADTAAAARVAAAPGGLDLIVLDFVLPDMDGVALLRQWRHDGLAVPVLALTGALSESVLEELLRAGANHVLDKNRLTRGAFLDALGDAMAPPVFQPEDKARPPAVPAPPAPVDDPIPGGRALVIDDVAATRRMIAIFLRQSGWEVDEAQTAAEGVRLADAGDHDVILLDYLLPDVDGVGVLHELRRRGVDAPVIVVSAHGEEQLATEFALSGAVDFLSKDTLTRERLLEAVRLALGSRGAVRLK